MRIRCCGLRTIFDPRKNSRHCGTCGREYGEAGTPPLDSVSTPPQFDYPISFTSRNSPKSMLAAIDVALNVVRDSGGLDTTVEILTQLREDLNGTGVVR